MTVEMDKIRLEYRNSTRIVTYLEVKYCASGQWYYMLVGLGTYQTTRRSCVYLLKYLLSTDRGLLKMWYIDKFARFLKI
jgi:hypothetical protein